MIKLVEDFNRSKVSMPAHTVKPSDLVYTFVLTANTEQTVSIPEGTNFIRIKRGSIKKEYAANVIFSFGTTPLVFPTVSGWNTTPQFCLAGDMIIVDVKETHSVLRVLSDENVKVQVCFYC